MVADDLFPEYDLAPLAAYPRDVLWSENPTRARVDRFVLTLALIHNDFKSILWLQHQLRRRGKPDAAISAQVGEYFGLGIFVSRQLLGLTHELLEATKDAMDGSGWVNDDVVTQALAALTPALRSQWEAIVAAANQTADRDNPFRHYLVNARNRAAFHYDAKSLHKGYRAHFIVAPPSEYNAHAYASIGPDLPNSRFYFADAAVVGLYARELDPDQSLFGSADQFASHIATTVCEVVHRYLEARVQHGP
jgi:hypothetical protein